MNTSNINPNNNHTNLPNNTTMQTFSNYVFVVADSSVLAGIARDMDEMATILDRLDLAPQSREVADIVAYDIFNHITTPNPNGQRATLRQDGGAIVFEDYDRDTYNHDGVVADIFAATYKGQRDRLARIYAVDNDGVEHRINFARYHDDDALPLSLALQIMATRPTDPYAQRTQSLTYDGTHAVIAPYKQREDSTEIVSEEDEALQLSVNGHFVGEVESVDEIVEWLYTTTGQKANAELVGILSRLWLHAKTAPRGLWTSQRAGIYRDPKGEHFVWNKGRQRNSNGYCFGYIMPPMFSGCNGSVFSLQTKAIMPLMDAQIMLVRERRESSTAYVSHTPNVRQLNDPLGICSRLAPDTAVPARDEFQLFPVILPGTGQQSAIMLQEQSGWKVSMQVCTWPDEDTCTRELQRWIDKKTTTIIDCGLDTHTFLLLAHVAATQIPLTQATAKQHTAAIEDSMQRAAAWYKAFGTR